MKGLQNQSVLFSLHQDARINRTKTIMAKALPASPFGPILLAVVLLAGCASKPTVNTASSRTIAVPQYYTVKSGDTISKIAARYNLDYRELARINNIDSSYVIYTNQSLRLYDPRKGIPRVPVKTVTVASTPVLKSQTINTTNTTTSVTRAPVATPSAVNSAPPKPVPVAPVMTAPATVTSSQPQPVSQVPAVSAAMPVSSNIQWQWPAEGPILQQFDPATGVKGLRIGGKEGDSVRAAADGDVVYASNRLVEYGNLVLIRHVNGYVTAYAHNSKILVAENDRVRAGQKIAELGASGTTQNMLEFQVRLNGKPVNPLTLLPKK